MDQIRPDLSSSFEKREMTKVFSQAIETLRTIAGLSTDEIDKIFDTLRLPELGSESENIYFEQYYFDSSNLPLVKIPEEDVRKYLESLIKITDDEIRARTEMEDWDLIHVLSGLSRDVKQKESIRRQLLNEMSYRYFMARDILAPIIFHWVKGILLDASKVPGSKIVFLYRDAYLAEIFSRFMIRNGFIKGISEDQLVVCNISRSNVNSELLNEYIHQQLGRDASGIFLVDTGITGSLIKPFADLYPHAKINAKYFVLKSNLSELGLDPRMVELNSYSNDSDDEVGYEHIEETCIPPLSLEGSSNAEFMGRAYDFGRDSSGHIVPIYRDLSSGSFGSNDGNVENLYLQSYRSGYLEYLERVKKGSITLPRDDINPEQLLKYGRKLLGTDDNPGLNIIKSIMPHSSLVPANDDVAELIKLRDKARSERKLPKFNYNDSL